LLQPPQDEDELDPLEPVCAKKPEINLFTPRCPHSGHSISSVSALIAQSFSNLFPHLRHSNS